MRRLEPMDALILAAGQGSRMGGRKARLLLGGVPLVLAHVRRLRELGVERVHVVSASPDVEWIAREVKVTASDAPDPAGSLAVGLRAIRLSLGARTPLLVVPVDSLPVSRDVLASLARALGTDRDAATPTFGDRGGHPILVRASALARYETESPPLHDVLRELGGQRVRVPVAEADVVVDLDTVDDVLRITGSAARFLEDDTTH